MGLHGYGTYHMPCGDVYKGEYSNNYMSGWGHYAYNNGDTYTGQWSEGVSEGLGRYVFKDYGSYVGAFKGGHVDGFGIMTLAAGQGVYTGYWEAGLREGDGHCVTNNSHYEGSWRQGKEDGLGLTHDKRLTHYGHWRGGVRHGKGIADHTNRAGTQRYLVMYTEGTRSLLSLTTSEEGASLLQDAEWASILTDATPFLDAARTRSYPKDDLQQRGEYTTQLFHDEQRASKSRVPPDDLEDYDDRDNTQGSNEASAALRRELAELRTQNAYLLQENASLEEKVKLANTGAARARRHSLAAIGDKWQTTTAKMKATRMQTNLESAKEQTEKSNSKIKDLEMQMALLTSSENAFIREGENLQEFLGSGDQTDGIHQALELRQKLEIAEAQASAFEGDDEANEELGTVRNAMGLTVSKLNDQILAERNQIEVMQQNMSDMAASVCTTKFNYFSGGKKSLRCQMSNTPSRSYNFHQNFAISSQNSP